MKIFGVSPTSIIDFNDKICTVLFLSGCNFRCGYCHNSDIVKSNESLVSVEDTLKDLDYRKSFIDGIVVTGGEPTIHPDLEEFLVKLKDIGLPIKLNTNGYIYDSLSNIIDKKLVDYISMDVKAPLDRYKVATSTNVKKQNIEKSIDLIMTSGIDYEFVTTIVPTCIQNKEDIRKMGRYLKGAKAWILQQYRNVSTLSEAFLDIQPYDEHKLQEFRGVAEEYVDNVVIKNV